MNYHDDKTNDMDQCVDYHSQSVDYIGDNVDDRGHKKHNWEPVKKDE